MNTRLLMTLSAIVLGLAGLLLTFAPNEVATYLSIAGPNAIILQITGSLYFGFAMLNWTAKANLIGGIYSKPVAIGNFTHFFIAGAALAKQAFNHSALTITWIAIIIYIILAMLFGYVLFTNPVLKKR